MTIEPLRFIHAANTGLDTPVRTTESLPDSVVPDFQNARLRSFEFIVRACRKHNVDFLLLSGNTFTERERSLHSRLTLRTGFENLADAGIDVYVIPDRSNPAEAWKAIPQLPGNVAICDNWSDEPVAVTRNNKLLATIANGSSYETRDEFGILVPTIVEPHESRTFRIGVFRPRTPRDPDDDADILPLEEQCSRFLAETPTSYLVLQGIDDRQTCTFESGIAHCPGRTQGRAPRDDNEFGCSLIERNRHGKIRLSHIPTATVVWHDLQLVLNNLRKEEDFVHRLCAKLNSMKPQDSERVWLLHWTIRGNGPLFEELDRPEIQASIIRRFEDAMTALPVKCVHTFRLVPGGEIDLRYKPMAAEYMAFLDDKMPVNSDALTNILSAANFGDQEWLERLTTIIPELDPELIAGQARRLGLDWFSSVRDEGAPQ